jgi:hypothetical protein
MVSLIECNQEATEEFQRPCGSVQCDSSAPCGKYHAGADRIILEPSQLCEWDPKGFKLF